MAISFLGFGGSSFAENVAVENHDIPKPSPAQLAWQEAEFGLVYHYDIHLFDNVRYNQPKNRRTHFKDINIFNPARLDTDQWIAAAKACGAHFAIITACHETGFRLWRSDVNPYSVRNVRWGGGKRDIVKEFVESCRRARIKPGIYIGARWNGQLGVLNFRVTKRSPITQEQYNRLIEKECEELFTRYGELFEVWFDGGILTPDEGGPDVLSIFEKYQPNCLFYHSDQRRDARWGGTETGTVGYPCWATVNLEDIRTGIPWSAKLRDLLRHGDPNGKDWCPAMADAPLRNHEWFWEPGDEKKIYSPEALVDMYHKSVGRNATLILGATPDNRGLIPDADMRRLTEMGQGIRKEFAKPLAITKGPGRTIELPLPEPTRVSRVVIQEDIRYGERVREYELLGKTAGGDWTTLAKGTCIGHKRIEEIMPLNVAAIRLVLSKAVATPIIKTFAAYA